MADSDSTPGKAPAFQFYPKDFITDERVRLMSLAERGAYITLICQCWTEGTLPADTLSLSRLCEVQVSAFRKLWPAIEPCFRVSSDPARLIHPRLDRERRKQRAYRRKQAENGKRGGRPPQNGKPIANPSLSTHGLAKESSSSSSSSSSSNTNVRAFRLSDIPDDVSERAGRFCERYAVLYQQHRKGARYLGKPNLDYLEAVTLCQTWPDARLEQIATVFLTTDHEFAEKGSRTMAQFRAMASWCDSKLMEAGIA